MGGDLLQAWAALRVGRRAAWGGAGWKEGWAEGGGRLAVGGHDAVAIATDGGMAVAVIVLVAATVHSSFAPLLSVRKPSP